MKVFLSLFLNMLTVCLVAQTDLSAFIKKLSKDHKVEVAVDPSLLKQNLTIEQNPSSMTEVFNLLSKIGLDYYVISDNYILLRKANIAIVKTQTINGQIFDKKSGQPIAYAAVYLTDMTNGTSTDENGRFSLKVNGEGKHQMEVSYLGYENQKFTNNGEAVNIAMVESQIPIEQVTIIASPMQKIDFATAHFIPDYSSYKILRINSNDLARTIQLSIPGVSRTDNAQIMIRNMRQDKTLSVVQNIPVLKTGHYYNMISNFNELYFNEIDVYKNVFPSQYGNALGGLVKYTSNNNVNKNFGFNTSTNLLYSGFGGFINHKNLSLSIGARKSYIGFNKNGLLKQNLYQLKFNNASNNGIVSNIPDASFSDVNFQMAYKYGGKNKITINGLANFDEDMLSWENKNQLFNGNQSTEITQDYFNNQKNNHKALSVSNETFLTSKLRWTTDAHVYRYQDTFNLVSKKIFNGNNENNNDAYNQSQQVRTQGIASNLEYSLSKKQSVVAGIYLKEVQLDFKAIENNRTIVDLKQKALQSTMYGEYNIYDALYTIKFGSKLTNFSNISKVYGEPYANVSYKITPDLSVKSSYAYRVQNLGLMDFEARFSQNLNYYYLSNDTLAVQKGHHFMLGSRYVKNAFTFDVEAYSYHNSGNQLFTNVITGFSKNKNPGPQQPPQFTSIYKFFNGTNTIVGIDFLVNYTYQNWQSNINYTLSKSVQTFSGIYRNQEIPSPTDRRHALSFNNSMSLGKWNFGTNMAFMSGSPYVSYNLAKPDKGKNDFGRKDVIEYLPNYVSLDVAASYMLLTKPFKLNLGLSILNVTNHNNVKFIQQTGSFDDKKNMAPIVTGNQSLMLGRFFNLSVKTSF
jgi:ferric enterobactin receptor